MAKLNFPPTKSSLFRIQSDLELATEGFELLEQKRQILILELMRRVEDARKVQEEMEGKLKEAYGILRKAVLRSGSYALKREALAVQGKSTFRIEGERLMGLEIPTIQGTVGEFELQYGFGGGGPTSDRVMKIFLEVLGLVLKLAEVENAVFRLAREVKKTQRRVNALEKIFIPDYQETLFYINGALEEREREAFVIMRMIKERLERKMEEG